MDKHSTPHLTPEGTRARNRRSCWDR